MKETFEDYLQRLKDRRTEDGYKYTDEDFENYIYYIFDCYEKGMSVYKCLEFMYFAERDMDDQLFNRESKQECTITKIMQMEGLKSLIDMMKEDEELGLYKEIVEEKLDKIVSKEPSKFWAESEKRNKMKETLEEAAERYNSQFIYKEENKFAKEDFINGARWQQEISYSEDEINLLHKSILMHLSDEESEEIINQLFKQFKKK
jgi:hypothetical protein